jgi:hypothetical protein
LKTVGHTIKKAKRSKEIEILKIVQSLRFKVQS